MTTTQPRPVTTRPYPLRRQVRGSALARILRTTDAKQIGIMYMVSAFGFFMIGGFMALIMRAELARPGMQLLSPEQYNQLFTMHGTIMLLFFATPIVFAFANYVVPIQIGAPDVAFPRLNAFAYWLYLVRWSDRRRCLPDPFRCGRLRLDRVHAVEHLAALAGLRRQHVGGRPRLVRSGHHPRRRQHHHHHPDAARTRHDDVPAADLHVEHPHHQPAGHRGVPVPGGGAVRAGRRPGARCACLRRGDRRADVVAAPVLVLRSPRGVRHRAAVLRHRHRGRSGVQPQAGVRLQRAGSGDDPDRDAVLQCVGAPHVRHRSRCCCRSSAS